jgi:hypothetical protein
MSDGKFVVLINAAEGRDDEFNTWYTTQHMPDVLRIPGLRTAQRFQRMERQRTPDQPYKYSAMYDIDAGMAPQIIAELNRRGGTPEMPITTSIAEPRYVGFFEAIAPRQTAERAGAPRFTFLVMTNAAEGREDEFNDWYNYIHIPDLLKIPGIAAARRYKLLPTQRNANQPWKYLCVYECDAERQDVLIAETEKRVGTPQMTMSTAMVGPIYACYFQPITPLVQTGEIART